MEKKRIIFILSFITALLVANVSGPQYVFPTFGPSLASKFHWSSMENSVVGTAVFVGVSFSGPLCAWLVDRFGFRITLTISSLTTLLGSLLLAETYAGHLSNHYILCSSYLVCIGAASSASYLCALDSQAYNFKTYRGMSLGFTSASLGISGLVFTQLNDRLFKSKTEQDTSTFQFLIFFGCTTALITLFASFILGPIRFGLLNTSSDSTASISNSSSSSTRGELDPLLSKNVVEIEEDEMNVYGSAVFLDPVGLSLCLSLVVLLGLGYVYLANIGNLITSLSMDEMNLSEAQHLRNLHISIFSVSNCLTRASLGTLSDLLQRRAGVHRIWFIWSGTLGLFFASLSLATFVSDENDLLVYSVWIAIPYGIAFGIAPAIISEFGTKVKS
ncbi:unnamed protein product [Rhizopus stolonifer]